MEPTTENLYNLTIRIYTDGLFISANEESGQLVTSKRINISTLSLSTEQLKDILVAETQFNYNKLRISCETDIYTFIPSVFFYPEEITNYLSYQHKMVKTDQICSNHIPFWEVVNVFTIPNNIYKAVNQLFPELTIEQHLTTFLADEYKSQQGNVMYTVARQKMLDIIVLTNGRLQLLNSFPYQTTEDFSYHVLNVIEQLTLDIEKCILYLSNPYKIIGLEKPLNSYLTIQNL